MDLGLPCVPVGWLVALFSRLGQREDVLVLREVGWAPSEYASLGGPVGGHSIDSVESGIITSSLGSRGLPLRTTVYYWKTGSTNEGL